MESIAPVKCFSTIAHKVGREQEEAPEQQENCAMGGHGGNVVGWVTQLECCNGCL